MGAVLGCVKRLGAGDEERQQRYEAGMSGYPLSFSVKYGLGDVIAESAHGRTCIAKDSATGKRYIVKFFFKSAKNFPFLDFNNRAMRIPEFRNCRLRHELITSYYHFSESRDLFCSVQDLLEGVSIRSFLKHRIRCEEAVAAKIFKQMLVATNFLHLKGIVHRDLRLEQFMFVRPKQWKVQLCDLMHIAVPSFGQMVIDPGKPVVMLFAAPEVLMRGEYSWMSDMWSAGCMLYELLYGHPPFPGEGHALAARVVQQDVNYRPLFSDASNDVLRLLYLLLNKDPYKRAKASQALSHRWFQTSAKITEKQLDAERERRRALEKYVGEQKTYVAKQRLQREAFDKAEEGRRQAQSEYSRTLTATCSHLSSSTLSADEEALSLGSDSSEDWQLGEDRSDLGSGAPPSGASSHSNTYENSIEGWLARSKGDWDEFDSQHFLSDVAKSSLWSEAEYSDWTVDEDLRRVGDEEFYEWVDGRDAAPLPASPPAASKEASSKVTKQTKDGRQHFLSSEGASGWGDSAAGSEAPAAAAPAAASQGWSASEELESAARDRSDPSSSSRSGSGNRSGSGMSSSSSSAPWEFTERSGDSTSSGAGAGQPLADGKTAKARKGKRPAPIAPPAALQPIAEGEQLVLKSPAGAGGSGPAQGASLGELTNRALGVNPAPWDAGAGDGAAAAGQGFIALSRRSNSSSGSSRPGDGSQRSRG